MQNVLAIVVVVAGLVLGAWWFISQTEGGSAVNFEQIYQKSIDAMGSEAALSAINSISATADATSPDGAYTLEVLSARPNRARVTFTEADGASTMLNVHGEQAWTFDPEGVPVALGNIDRAFILGHEFQMLPIEVNERFSDHEYLGLHSFANQNTVHIKAVGEPDNLPYDLYFDPVTGLMQGMSFPDFLRNPETKVNIHFAEWRWIDQVQLPCKVIVIDASGEFILAFNDIQINTLDISLFDVPEGVLSDSG